MKEENKFRLILFGSFALVILIGGLQESGTLKTVLLVTGAAVGIGFAIYGMISHGLKSSEPEDNQESMEEHDRLKDNLVNTVEVDKVDD